MPLVLDSGPLAEPVSLAAAKLHLRVDGNDEDALISALIASAREACEHITGRSIINQGWSRILDGFPPAELELGRPPLVSVQQISYIDASLTTIVLAPSAYAVDQYTDPGFVLPAVGTSWPSAASVANAVRVTFTAGFGVDEVSVPASIRNWILLHVGTWYRNREAASDGQRHTIPTFDGLLDRWRVWR